MNETNKINTVLIIPYFGKIPDYFNLWLKSAEKILILHSLYILI